MTSPLEQKEFRDWLATADIAPEWYKAQVEASRGLPRHLWLLSSALAPLQAREAEVTKDALHVSGVEQAVALPQGSKVKGLPVFEAGAAIGIDLASIMAVLALEPKPGEDVLDLCCAPGAKMVILADLMQRRGVLVGVDVSPHRVQTCAQLLRKYHVMLENTEARWQVCLVEADGTDFDSISSAKRIVWDIDADRVFREGDEHGKRKRVTKSMRKEIEKRRKLNAERSVPKVNETKLLFDKILVDSECTHDGSIKHMEKYLEDGAFGAEAFVTKFLNNHGPKKERLQDLQRKLILHGAELLKGPGSTLVYSTCSFSTFQNEDIVAWLLNESDLKGKVELVNLEECKAIKESRVQWLQCPKLRGCLRFTPAESKTGGLFVAKIKAI